MGWSFHIWYVASSSDPLPNTSNYGPRVEISPMLLGLVSDFTITKKKKKSSPKLTIRLQSNFTEMILWLCSFKILKRIEIREETWLPNRKIERSYLACSII